MSRAVSVLVPKGAMQKCQAAWGFKMAHLGPAFTWGHNFEPQGCLTLLCEPKGTNAGPTFVCPTLQASVGWIFSMLQTFLCKNSQCMMHQPTKMFDDTSQNCWVHRDTGPNWWNDLIGDFLLPLIGCSSAMIGHPSAVINFWPHLATFGLHWMFCSLTP